MKFKMVSSLLVLITNAGFAGFDVELSSLQERPVMECGVKSYRLKDNHPSCGISSYKTGRGPACGVESYVSRKDRLCGAEQYKEGTGGACGYDRVEKSRCILKNPISTKDCIHGETWYDEIPRTCRHESFGVETYKTCGRAEFGVAAYKSCASPAFGTIYKSCRLPEFGVESYHSCYIRKTASELDIYLASTSPYIEVNAINMIKAQASYLFKAGQKWQTSCLIERWSEDPLYFGVVEDMKNTYLSLFGEDYLAQTYSCTVENERPALAYEGRSCLEFSSDQLKQYLSSPDLSQSAKYFFDACADMHLYETYKKWFADHLIEIENLQADIVAQKYPEYQKKLELLRLEIESVIPHSGEDSLQ